MISEKAVWISVITAEALLLIALPFLFWKLQAFLERFKRGESFLHYQLANVSKELKAINHELAMVETGIGSFGLTLSWKGRVLWWLGKTILQKQPSR